MKKWIGAAFVGFLAFMAVCTVIAKGIYRSGLARVTVCNPERKSITYQISAAGTVLPGPEYGVYAPEGLRVGTVCVQVGETVTDGDALFQVDPGDLAEQTRKAEDEIACLKAQLQDIAGEAKERRSEKERTAARLLADYDGLVREQDLRVQECALAADTANRNLRHAEKMRKNANAEGVSGSDADPGEAIPSALDVELLRAEYERALNTLEQAKLQKDAAVRDWNRSLEDARREGYTELAQTAQLNAALAQEQGRLEKLRILQQRQGVVAAETAGIVQEIFLRIGERTADGACIVYSALDGGGDVEVYLGKEEASRLSIGDSVTLKYKTLTGEKKSDSGIVTYIEPENEGKILRIRSEGAALLPGQTVQAESSAKSESYDCVLPVSALYEEERLGYYLYVVEPREGILGMEDRVQKIPVTVLEQNGQYAAVECPSLNAESAVVAGSDRKLLPDEVVRVLE